MNKRLSFSPSADQLRVKSGRISMARAREGRSKFCRSADRCDPLASGGQKFTARDSVGFAAQRPVRQRSLSADKHFWLLLVLQK